MTKILKYVDFILLKYNLLYGFRKKIGLIFSMHFINVANSINHMFAEYPKTSEKMKILNLEKLEKPLWIWIDEKSATNSNQ